MGTDNNKNGAKGAVIIQFPCRARAQQEEEGGSGEPSKNTTERWNADGVSVYTREERRHLQLLGAKRMIAFALVALTVVVGVIGTIALFRW